MMIDWKIPENHNYCCAGCCVCKPSPRNNYHPLPYVDQLNEHFQYSEFKEKLNRALSAMEAARKAEVIREPSALDKVEDHGAVLVFISEDLWNDFVKDLQVSLCEGIDAGTIVPRHIWVERVKSVEYAKACSRECHILIHPDFPISANGMRTLETFASVSYTDSLEAHK